MKQVEKKNKSPQLIEFYRKDRFLDLFIKTKKYTEFTSSKESLLSVVISVSITFLLVTIIRNNEPNNGVHQIIPILQNVIPILIGGLFGLLGFIIGGLALITGTISEKVIYKVDKEGNITELMSVIFNFYFSGMISGFTLIFLIMAHILTFISLPFRYDLFFVLSLLLSYLVSFSIIYSIMLLGTCIRILLLRYHILTKPDEDEDTDK